MDNKDIIPAVMNQIKQGVRHDTDMVMNSARENERRKIYEQLIEDYKKKHSLCPKCKSKESEVTNVMYRMDLNKYEDYKDLNESICSNCKDVHTVHERVSE